MIEYVCTSCGKSLISDEIIYRCPHCADSASSADESLFQRGNLLVNMDVDRVTALMGDNKILNPLNFFPYDIDFYDAFPVGNTPLVRPEKLRREFPRLTCKMESANPSGSFKDRASFLVAAQARYHGVKKVVLASTGNAGSAMSCAGAALDLNIVLFVPQTAPLPKLAQSVFYGARVVPVKGTYDDAFKMSIAYSEKYGGINRNTAFNPMTTEGKKSAAIEIINQYGGKVPDLVYIPVGDGVIYTGLCKGFEDLIKLKIIDHMPRCIAVQSEKSNAIFRSFWESREVILERAPTLADSISVCSPACGEPALQYLKKCDAWATEVSDCEILQAQKEISQKAGLFVEPSSAAAFAGLKKDRDEGRISGQESIVLLLTGTGFKDTQSVLQNITIPSAVDLGDFSGIENV